MTKKFKSLSTSLMIAFLLTAISCQVEEEAIQIDNNKLQYYTSKVNYKKLEENKTLINKLSNIEVLDNNSVKNTTSKIVYFSQYDFYIDTDVSNYIESVDGSYHSYSFPIIYLTDSDTGFIKNLVLSFNSTKNDYDTYIITYQVNEEEKQKIENNIFVDLTGKTSINTLNNFDIDSLLRFVYIDPDTGEYSCWEEIYGTSSSTGWDNQIIDYQQVDCFSGGGGSSTDEGTSGGGGTSGSGSGTPSGNYGDTGNNLGGSSGTGSGGGGNGSVVTSPIVAVNTSKEQIKRQNCFINSLSPSQQAFINNSNNSEIKEQVLAYLESQVSNFSAVCHQQSDMDFAEELIDYGIENNSQESIDEIINILDLIDDGKINGEEVLVGPETPITDMADYLSCFNTSQSATITIYADQPKSGTHNLYSQNDGVGHAFISIKQGNNIATLGFYPQSSAGSIIPNNLTLDPTDFFPTPGAFGNNQGYSFDVSLTIPINSSGLTNLINGIITVAEDNSVYNLASLNCTDFAIMVIESNTNVNIPSCESPRPYWNGQTPGTLGEVIRNMPTPAGGSKNTNGGNAPNNNCN